MQRQQGAGLVEPGDRPADGARSTRKPAHGRRVVALGLGAALLLGACGSGGNSGAASGAAPGASTEASGQVCTEERIGGSITMGTYAESAGLDPIVAAGSGVAGGTEAAAVFDRLMQVDTETGEVLPRVAESLEPNADFTTWTLVLKPGITFGNGDPLTADAVVFSVERMQSDKNRTSSRGAALTISGVTALDDRTVQYTVPEPWPTFPYLLADEVGMVVNPAVVAALTPDQFAAMPVGAGVGPYEPERFAPGEEIVLRAKTDYWGGPVCIEKLRFITVPGSGPTYDAFDNGEMEVAFLREPIVIARAQADGIESYTNLQSLGWLVLMNNGISGTPPTADPRVRKAVALAVDQQALDARINDGTGSPTNRVIAEGSLHHQEGDVPAPDPARARQLVDEVKAETGWDGKIRLTCGATEEEMALVLEAQLTAAGFQVETDAKLTKQDHIKRVRVDSKYDLACYGSNLDDASVWLRLRQLVGSEGDGVTGYADPDMDAALDLLREAPDLDAQRVALGAVQSVWDETMPSVPLFGVDEVVIWADKVHGLDFTAKTVVLFSDAYIER